MSAVEVASNEQPFADSDYVTCAQAATALGVAPGTVGCWASAGKLPGTKKMSRMSVVGKPGPPMNVVPFGEVKKYVENLSPASLRLMRTRAKRPDWGRGKRRSSKRATPAVPRLKVVDQVHQEKNDAVLTTPEVAELLGRNSKYVSTLVTKGKLTPFGRAGIGGQYLFYRNDVEMLVGEQPVLGKPAGAEVMPTVSDCLTKLETDLRELRYALGRESKGRQKMVQDVLAKALEGVR